MWENLLRRDEQLIVTNYVLLETIALAQRRHGIPFVQNFQLSAVPVLSVHWVDASIMLWASRPYLPATAGS